MHNPHTAATVLTEKPKNIVILTMVRPSPACVARSSGPEKGQHDSRFNISSGLSWSTALPTASSRPTARMQSPNSPNKLHNNLVFQPDKVQHMIIEAKERWHVSIKPSLPNCATRLQWASHLGLEHHNLPPPSLPWLLQHSIFVINRFLVRSNGQTSFAANYGYNYAAALLNFGEIVYADIKRIDNRKLAIRNEHQKVTGIWLGRGHITGQHLIALPDQHRDHPAVSGNNIYKTRHVTRLPQEQQFNQTFLWTIEWPLFDISHLPQPTNDDVQPAVPLPKASLTTRSSTATSSSSPTPAAPPSLQPPPGIPLPKQLPGAHLRSTNTDINTCIGININSSSSLYHLLRHHHKLILQQIGIVIRLVPSTWLTTPSPAASCILMSTRAQKKLNNLHRPCWTTSSWSPGTRTTCHHMPTRTSSKPRSTSSNNYNYRM